MLIIFDLDGTLFQTAACSVNALHKLFDEINIKRIPDADIVSRIGKSTAKFLGELLPTSASISLDVACTRFRELERIEVEQCGIVFPKVPEMLQKLKENGHSLCVCSTGSIEYIKLVLNSTGIAKYFDNIYSAKNYASKGEAIADIIKYNYSNTKLTDAIVIGDTIIDAESADSNNIPFIGAAYGYGSTEELLSSVFIANTVNEITSYVAQCAVYYQVYNKIHNSRWHVVGINGVDTSGKTQFTNQFSKFLNSIGHNNTIIHIDDFHNPCQVRKQGENEIEAYYKNAFNYKQLINELLEPLQNESYIDKNVTCLNLDTDKYENIIHYSVDKNTLVLIEGVLLFREPINKYLDGKIFIKIDFNEVIRRATVRDVPKYGEAFLKKYYDKYIPIQKRYLNNALPEQNSDIVIDNQDFCYPKINII